MAKNQNGSYRQLIRLVHGELVARPRNHSIDKRVYLVAGGIKIVVIGCSQRRPAPVCILSPPDDKNEENCWRPAP
jgi:hypothetical protein